MIHWLYYPRSRKAPPLVLQVVEAFRSASTEIDSAHHNLPSNGVLAHLVPPLVALGFRVETGRPLGQKIQVPVLFGLDGQFEKSFEADASRTSPVPVALSTRAGAANHDCRINPEQVSWTSVIMYRK